MVFLEIALPSFFYLILLVFSLSYPARALLSYLFIRALFY
jgi:hypothetical protein